MSREIPFCYVNSGKIWLVGMFVFFLSLLLIVNYHSVVQSKLESCIATVELPISFRVVTLYKCAL